MCLADAEALPMDLLRRLQGVEATNIKHLSMQQARVISLKARWFPDLSRISWMFFGICFNLEVFVVFVLEVSQLSH